MRIVVGFGSLLAVLVVAGCTSGGQSGTDQQDVNRGDDAPATGADDDASDDDSVTDDDSATDDDVSDDDTGADDDASDDDTAPVDDIMVADDDIVVADDDTVVADDDTVVADDDTVVADDDTAADDDVVADDDTVSSGGTSGAGAGGRGGSNTGGANTGGDNTGVGGTSVGGSGQGGTASPPDRGCPADPPETGSACVEPWVANGGLGIAYAHCSWGDDPRPACRTIATCSSGAWQVTTPTDASCNTPPLSDSCPVDPPTVGDACDDAALDCWYPEGSHCFCSACAGGSAYPLCRQIDPPQWACPVAPAECPAVIPQAGTSCDQPDASCGPDCELQVLCQDSVWQWNSGMCPICAAPTTLIATPSGEREISSIHVGDLVYSVNGDAIEAVPVVRVGSTPVSHHEVMRVTLRSGSVLEISPGHPTADGRRFGELQAGDLLDDQDPVTDARLVPYTYDRTYDILPASDTGTYFAGGALIGSTLSSRFDAR